MKVDSKVLVGKWTHSHEEDRPGEMVFRPATYAFPLSRGRRSIDLAAGGKLVHSGTGPTDRTQQTAGSWQVNGDRLTLDVPGSSPQRYVVSSADPEKLVLRELPPQS